ncbi:hypothetical protein CCMSSC00406_0007697 [Pleurotus cornucopiae]|uniref:Uncharacterized protein n=1 Tax=Pleurotus cornucopiae TaxID=5321 RepID=A0ACB7J0T0_PLECO|nr:hypothetical protein CCMSSC00406_0007697 [Pleurotus cornucopiae]
MTVNDLEVDGPDDFGDWVIEDLNRWPWMTGQQDGVQVGAIFLARSFHSLGALVAYHWPEGLVHDFPSSIYRSRFSVASPQLGLFSRPQRRDPQTTTRHVFTFYGPRSEAACCVRVSSTTPSVESSESVIIFVPSPAPRLRARPRPASSIVSIIERAVPAITDA